MERVRSRVPRFRFLVSPNSATLSDTLPRTFEMGKNGWNLLIAIE